MTGSTPVLEMISTVLELIFPFPSAPLAMSYGGSILTNAHRKSYDTIIHCTIVIVSPNGFMLLCAYMKPFIVLNQKSISTKTTGLGWISYLSTLSVSQAQHIEWHAHDSIEIVICHHGTPRYEFESIPPIVLHPGCFLVIQPHFRHRLYDGIDGHVSRSSIFLRPPKHNTRIKDFFSTGEYRDIIAHILTKRLKPRLLSSNMEHELLRLSLLIKKGNEMNDLERIEMRALIIAAVVHIAAVQRHENEMIEENIIDKATSWIDAHLGQKFALNDLISHIGYGRSRFFTLFKERTGLSPLEWTIQRRIEKAKTLLCKEKMPVTDIAHAVGFQSSVFFSKTFRIHTGKSPVKWRALKFQDT